MYLLPEELAKLEKLGVTVAVKLRNPKNKDKKVLAQTGGESALESDGFFAHGEKSKAFAIVVTVASQKDTAVVMPGPKKYDEFSPLKPMADTRTCVRLVSTHDVYGGRSTLPEDNSLTIISAANGLLQVFSAGVVTRINNSGESQYFLVVQEMYKAKLYREPVTQKVTVREDEFDGYKKWPALRQTIEELIGDKKLPTPYVINITGTGKKTDIPPVLKERRARILFFDIRKGFGMAETSEGVRYFNWGQTETPDRLPYFEKGQLVSFSETHESSHGLQLLGVKAID